MALTISVVKRTVSGNARHVYVDVTGDSSYPTGGEAVTAAMEGVIKGEPTRAAVNLSDWVVFASSETNPAGYRISVDTANDKILFFDVDSEVANATDLSAVTVRCRIDYGFPTG